MLIGSSFWRHASVAACIAVLSVATAGVTRAQRDSLRPTRVPKALQTLDSWVVTRFREAHLLPDSVAAAGVVASEVAPPRVESVGDAPTGDTVYALHFANRRDMSALRVGTRVRLTAPSGPITAINADIVARRPFRAPRVPGADTTAVGGWRFGWAYLAIVRRPHAMTSASVYRGWLLFDASDASPRR